MDATRRKALRDGVVSVLTVTGRENPRESEIDLWVSFIEMALVTERTCTRLETLTDETKKKVA